MVHTKRLLLTLLTAIDRTPPIFGEYNSLRRTVARTGRTIVLTMGWVHHPDTAVDHLINAKRTEIKALAALRTAVLVNRRVPRIIARPWISEALTKVYQRLCLQPAPGQQTPDCPLMTGCYPAFAYPIHRLLVALLHQLTQIVYNLHLASFLSGLLSQLGDTLRGNQSTPATCTYR